MTDYINDITRVTGGYRYDLDAAPLGGYDVWLDGDRIGTRITDNYWVQLTSENTAPPIEFTAGWEDTPSVYASQRIRLQWQHFDGAEYYIVERSTDNVTWNRFGIVRANGNIYHSFDGAATADATYYRVYAASRTGSGAYYKTSYPLPCMITLPLIPSAPRVSILASAGDAVLTEDIIIDDDPSLQV